MKLYIKLFFVLLFSIFFICNVSADKNKSNNFLQADEIEMQSYLLNSIALIATGKESLGLKDIQTLIEKDPKTFKNSYHKLYLNPNLAKYTDILKSGYNRMIDILTFKALAKQTGEIDKYMQDSAITYIFFSSKKEFMSEHLPLMELYEHLMKNGKQSNTKDNKELLAIFKANYMISQNKQIDAYKILANNAPYHQKSLKALSYFSNIKDIPLFEDRMKLLQSINVKNFQLKEALFEHHPQFLFDFDGNKILLEKK